MHCESPRSVALSLLVATYRDDQNEQQQLQHQRDIAGAQVARTSLRQLVVPTEPISRARVQNRPGFFKSNGGRRSGHSLPSVAAARSHTRSIVTTVDAIVAAASSVVQVPLLLSLTFAQTRTYATLTRSHSVSIADDSNNCVLSEVPERFLYAGKHPPHSLVLSTSELPCDCLRFGICCS